MIDHRETNTAATSLTEVPFEVAVVLIPGGHLEVCQKCYKVSEAQIVHVSGDFTILYPNLT